MLFLPFRWAHWILPAVNPRWPMVVCNYHKHKKKKEKKESPSKNSSFILNIHKSNNLKFSIKE
jgi:hypothetical protein